MNNERKIRIYIHVTGIMIIVDTLSKQMGTRFANGVNTINIISVGK